MFYEIIENKLAGVADEVRSYWIGETKELPNVTKDEYLSNINKYSFIDGEIKDISTTSEYLSALKAKENEIRKKELQLQIDILDIKRIRAIAEPQLKDPSSGQTWLEFFTSQIQELRAAMAVL